MKNFNNKSLFNLIKSKGLLLIAGSSLLVLSIQADIQKQTVFIMTRTKILYLQALMVVTMEIR